MYFQKQRPGLLRSDRVLSLANSRASSKAFGTCADTTMQNIAAMSGDFLTLSLPALIDIV
jgi:hypothetical protein